MASEAAALDQQRDAAELAHALKGELAQSVVLLHLVGLGLNFSIRVFVGYLKILQRSTHVLRMTTEDVECFHSTSHKKRDVPTVLEPSRDFGSKFRENIKELI